MLTLEGSLFELIKKLKKPPVQLFGIGGEINTLLDRPRVAIVGTRKMSPYGKIVTEKIASALARAGVVVVSGNALGVDITAQKAALEAGGLVIAVVPSGLDAIYPATNRAVAQKIIDSGG